MRLKYNRTSVYRSDGKRFDLDKSAYTKTYFDRGVSGTIAFEARPAGSDLMMQVRENHRNGVHTTVVFQDLSRLGRTLLDSLNTLSKLLDDYGCRVEIIDQQLYSHNKDGSPNPTWGIISNTLLAVYQMERNRILEITSNARRRYVELGGRLGRPHDSKESDETFLMKLRTRHVLRLLQSGKSVRDITGRVGCSSTTVTKVRKIAIKHNLLKVG